jgi:hypothetical protein
MKHDYINDLSYSMTDQKLSKIVDTVFAEYCSVAKALFGEKTAADMAIIVGDLFDLKSFSFSSDIARKMHMIRTSFYHTPFHCADLASRAHKFKYSNVLNISVEELFILMTAAFYHDYNHTHGMYKNDMINVGIAMKKFVDDVYGHRSVFSVINQYSSSDKLITDRILNVIEYSKFPYEKSAYDFELCESFRVLDVLQSLEDDLLASQYGLYSEMGMKIGFVEFLSLSSNFVRGFDHSGYFNKSDAKHLLHLCANRIDDLSKRADENFITKMNGLLL